MRKLLPDQFKASKNNCVRVDYTDLTETCVISYSFFKILTLEEKNMSLYNDVNATRAVIGRCP